MRTITAEEIMIPLGDYPHITYNHTLRQAIEEFEKSELEINGRKSLPRVILVFDEDFSLMGTVRRRDILRGLEPDFLLQKPLEHRKNLFHLEIDPNLSEFSYEKIIQGIKAQAERTVMDIMLPIVATVRHDDHITKVMYELVIHNVSLLPVVRDGEVVGIVRSVDVFSALARIVFE